MNNISTIEIFMSDKRIGRMAITPDEVCGFEYDSDWIKTGFSISPFYMPLKSGLIMAKRDPFWGNFGVFDDSLPDGWGNLLLDRYLQEKGIDPYKLSILERLSLIGSTGRGALEYRPDKSIITNDEFIEFDRLAKEAEKILESKESEGSVDLLYKYGGSSGGARPKVFARIDGREWLVKFKATNDPVNVGEIEYNYSLLAKECGIRMAETRLFNDRYFGVERFDRTPHGKIHTISAAGLLHANYRIPSLDYSILLKLTLNLTKDMEQVISMFRLMIFNILISNRDDHAKNFSFQWINGTWKLSPAYDLLPSSGFNGYHTTTINGKGEPELSDIITVASEVGIQRQNAIQIVQEVSNKCIERKCLNYKLK
ncbi:MULTISPECIES: type II toxin-antitoxin system HipA family toxin [unclassified Bacteroides]|jgi:serine/threonine-protein kinase HipA|uniref:type II toxin-antitoxin system HipA family toxin n=1 Tax=unclassified Bacteroides TaxID=2646097 RepID=UPI000E7D4C88|nr:MULTISPECIES: type II toxin-antitoxin system HipA family toxin [unclassified Bacteroides]RGN51179.1 type II toxin-antitoxin system HipA family toxin [Bacteroides sp. OM05-12]RHR78706.1 type II toxin-antitoxin system HipA family toxin [Bacteroides sp. AF16-49]